MQRSPFLALILAAAICKTAAADDKYTLRENLHAGDKIAYSISQQTQDNSDVTADGKQTIADTHTVQAWTVTENVLAVNDGSATQARMDISPDSLDTTQEAGQPEKKTPCPFAGKSITLKSKPDGSVDNDFTGNASTLDLTLLGGMMSADEDNYPDHPVAIGDTWDNSARQAKKMSLGPNDRFSVTYKLESVQTTGGKPMAQITFKSVFTYHVNAGPNGLLASDTDDEQTGTMLVDIAAGTIVKCDSKETIQVASPPGAAVKLAETISQSVHSDVLPDTGASPPAKP